MGDGLRSGLGAAMAVFCAVALLAALPAGAAGTSMKSGKPAKSEKAPGHAKSAKRHRSGKSCKSDGCDGTVPPEPECLPGQVPDLAVEVTAVGDLVITGDACPNYVLIRPAGPAGNYIVATQPGATINGVEPMGDVVFHGATGSLLVDTRGGDDEVEIVHIPVLGNVEVDTGSGNGSTTLRDVDIGGDLLVLGHDGADTVSGSSVRIVGRAEYRMGGGDNGLFLDQRSKDDMTIACGDGDDVVRIVDASGSDAFLRIDVGGGRNRIEIERSHAGQEGDIRAGSGDDQLTIGTCSSFGGSLRIALGDGANAVELDGAAVGGNLTVEGGDGPDDVTVAGGLSTCPRAEVGGDLDVALGRGDDTLSVGDTTVGGTTRLDGGAGTDANLDQGANLYTVPPVVKHFELP